MPGCVALKTAKYKARPSPPYHAGDCKGKTLKGNDGRRYKSIADSRGVYKWVSANGSVSGKSANGKSDPIKKAHKTRKASAKLKSYEIHDNYNRPFTVTIDASKKELTVYKGTEKIHTTHYSDVFIGDNVARLKIYTGGKGNTILAHVSGKKYLYVGAEVFTFDIAADDVVVSYQSPIGNNDFPYPVAIGEKNIYFMVIHDYFYLPKELFDVKGDIYGQYYSAAAGLKPKKFKMKMIERRVGY